MEEMQFQKAGQKIGTLKPVREPTLHPGKMTLSGLINFTLDLITQKTDSTEIKKIPYSAKLISMLSRFVENPLEIFIQIDREYGKISRFRAPNNQLFIFISDPKAIKSILQHTDRRTKDAFDKSYIIADGGGKLLGKDNILAVSNQEWKSQHDLVSGFFTRGRYDNHEVVEKIKNAVSTSVDQLCERIKNAPGGVLKADLQEETTLIALRVAIECILGTQGVSNEKLTELREASRIYHSTIPFEALTAFNVPHSLLSVVSEESAEVIKSIKILSDFISDILSNANSDDNSIIGSMLKATQTSTPLLSREQVCNNMMAFLFAGHESTGNILAYMLGQCALNRGFEAQIKAESSHAADTTHVTLSDLNDNLIFTQSLIEESLRCHPPVYLLNRRATEEFKVTVEGKDMLIPEGAEVFMNIFSAHRDEATYGKEGTGYPANEFALERWIDKKSPIDLLSFGHGPRVCVGMHLFRTEAMLALPSFLNKISIEPLFNDLENERGSDFTLQKKGGYPVLLRLNS